MKDYDKIFNSEVNLGFKSFQLATGYISCTTILFENEKIIAKIEAKGHIDFFDCEDILLEKSLQKLKPKVILIFSIVKIFCLHPLISLRKQGAKKLIMRFYAEQKKIQ